MYALLGDVEFELITSMTGFDGSFSTNYAEHALIEGKPRLQFMGDALDEYTFTFSFHHSFCDPEAEMEKLQEARKAHRAQPFVNGSGQYKGHFIIVELQSQALQTTAEGFILVATATMTLREYVGDPKSPISAPAVNADLTSAIGVKSQVSSVATTIRNTVSSVVSSAKKAQSVVTAIRSTLQVAQRLQSNPASALSAIGGLSTQFDKLDKNLNLGLTGTKSLLDSYPDSRIIADTSSSALTLLTQARNSFNSRNNTNIDNVLTNLDTTFSSAQSVLSQNNSAMAKLTGDLIARKI